MHGATPFIRFVNRAAAAASLVAVVAGSLHAAPGMNRSLALALCPVWSVTAAAELSGANPSQGAPSIVSFPVRGYVAVQGAPVKVHKAPDPNSSILGFAIKGPPYALLIDGSTWSGINFQNTMGWVRATDVARSAAGAPVAQTPAGQSAPPPAPEQPAPAQEPAVDSTASEVAEQPAPEQVAPDPSAEVRQRARQRPPQEPKSALAISIDILKKMPAMSILGGAEPEEETVDSSDTSSLPIKYVEITTDMTRVLAYLDPSAPILGMARKGGRYLLLGEGTVWNQIEFGDTLGWVERRNTRVWEQARGQLAQNIPIISIIILAVFALVLLGTVGGVLFGGFMLVRKVARLSASTKATSQSKNCLIIATSAKKVEHSLAEQGMTLDKCFSEIGFRVTTAKDIMVARNILSHYPPDVICVDWEFAPDISTAVERIVVNMGAATTPVIFYNVPEASATKKCAGLTAAFYLGVTLTERDVLRFLPASVITQTVKIVRKSVEDHALEGDISEESLSEVFQFVEMGRKAGCLLVEGAAGPFGMIFFENGQIVHASTKVATGLAGVYSILNLKSGRFRFAAGRKSPGHTMNSGTLGVLMEWSRQKDEAARR
jgi:hypothetical protein